MNNNKKSKKHHGEDTENMDVRSKKCCQSIENKENITAPCDDNEAKKEKSNK